MWCVGCKHLLALTGGYTSAAAADTHDADSTSMFVLPMMQDLCALIVSAN